MEEYVGIEAYAGILYLHYTPTLFNVGIEAYVSIREVCKSRCVEWAVEGKDMSVYD